MFRIFRKMEGCVEMTVKEVAAMLGKTEQTIRVGLQLGMFPFGTAYKTNPDRKSYTYVIYPEKVRQYIGN